MANEIVAGTRRFALMNLFLHNIGDIDSDNNISPTDALIAPTDVRYDYVLANPPFGKKSSQTFTNEEGEQEKEDLTYSRQDFWATTSNKQLNFVQHIRSMLKSNCMLADSDNLPDPDVLAEEIAENLESALGSFREVIRQLKS